jgi:peptidoglycan hydrolase-like protein with peptidoglycan-binding domain
MVRNRGSALQETEQARPSRPGGPARRPRRIAAAFLIAGALFAVFAAGWWAARQAILAPADPLDRPKPIIYTVAEGSVGRSLSFAAVAEWSREPAARNAAGGTVTSIVVEPGQTVRPGQILYRVDLRPVIAAEGAIPMFRDLSVGLKGPDVAQLQRLLQRLGQLSGPISGEFDERTRIAVAAWQKSLELLPDGVVRRADVIFLRNLPARLALGDEILVGAALVGGEIAVDVVSRAPRFVIPLSPEQRQLVPLSGQVWITYPEGQWEARIAEAVEPAPGELHLLLEGPEGGTVCSKLCAQWVPLEGQANFPAEVVVVPLATGPVVPVAAISTTAAGRAEVTLSNGRMVEVRIVASGDGLAVVDGVALGDRIILPVQPPDASGAPTGSG